MVILDLLESIRGYSIKQLTGKKKSHSHHIVIMTQQQAESLFGTTEGG